MKNFLKDNFALFLAFSLPIILIVVVVCVTYIPSASIKTNYNFIYSMCMDNNNHYPYNCNDYSKEIYSVADGKLLVNKNVKDDKDVSVEKYSEHIFFHDTQKNESREISLKEAQIMTLSDLLTSPDQITISSSYDRRGDYFIFPFVGGGYSSYGYYLTKGKSKSKLNLIDINDRYNYQNNFKFLGWVIPDRN